MINATIEYFEPRQLIAVLTGVSGDFDSKTTEAVRTLIEIMPSSITGLNDNKHRRARNDFNPAPGLDRSWRHMPTTPVFRFRETKNRDIETLANRMADLGDIHVLFIEPSPNGDVQRAWHCMNMEIIELHTPPGISDDYRLVGDENHVTLKFACTCQRGETTIQLAEEILSHYRLKATNLNERSHP